ncbi:MAG: cysteine--tRNA ligase [Minisyncoccia bacterium]
MEWLARIFKKRKGTAYSRPAHVFFTNSLSGTKELFIPQRPGIVSMYSCGPTVYSRAHIGNLRSFVFADTVARVLTAANYHMRRVINITDVGHLTSDADAGEDKMALGAAREKTTPEAIADRYTRLFIEDLSDLNIDTDDISFPRATDYIKEQIALAKTLEEKGFAYRLADGLYFDTQKFPGYGKLGGLSEAQREAGARVKVALGKRHPHDFVLWRLAKPNDLQQWDSPWGRGNPGWHIECSAMIRSLLGQEIDIHTGGEDLAQIHHNNEIAQSEAASGRTFVHYWMHSAFLTMGGEKASKSLGNVVYLSDLTEKKLDPLALRYFFLQAHYRTPLSFSWDAVSGAAEGLNRLRKMAGVVAEESKRKSAPSEARNRFLVAMRDDLATPQAIASLWESLKSEDYAPEEKWGLLQDAEKHLGIPLTHFSGATTFEHEDIPEEVQEMLAKREDARVDKDFATADRLRNDIEHSGYRVDDGPKGPVLTKRV